jgi:hypothetical protein
MKKTSGVFFDFSGEKDVGNLFFASLTSKKIPDVFFAYAVADTGAVRSARR